MAVSQSFPILDQLAPNRATIGVIGGVAAILALQISGPDQEFGHLIVWHSLTIVMSIAGGYLAGRRTVQS